jgi:hypothetical protein
MGEPIRICGIPSIKPRNDRDDLHARIATRTALGIQGDSHHRALTVRFLQNLFPGAQFVILRRDIREVAASAILASWSLRWFWDHREAMPVAMAKAIVRDVTYAILAIESGLDEVQAELGPRCLSLDYSQLLDADLGFLRRYLISSELALSDK